jgi:serine/threonine protein kinase
MEEKATVAAEPLMLVWARGLTGKSHELPAAPPIIYAQYERPFRDMTSRGLDSVYELEGGYESLGKGAFSMCVSPGKHRASGTRAAVKMVPRKTVGRPYTYNFIDKGVFDQLLRLTQDQAHTNVVKYLDFLASESCIYVVMEELQGEELLDVLCRPAPISKGSMRGWSRDALSALAHIHSASIGLVHRDVKPENLRFRDRQRTCLVLIDFGLCCPADARTRFCCGTSTVKGLAGTLRYMAPEIFFLVQLFDARRYLGIRRGALHNVDG